MKINTRLLILFIVFQCGVCIFGEGYPLEYYQKESLPSGRCYCFLDLDMFLNSSQCYEGCNNNNCYTHYWNTNWMNLSFQDASSEIEVENIQYKWQEDGGILIKGSRSKSSEIKIAHEMLSNQVILKEHQGLVVGVRSDNSGYIAFPCYPTEDAVAKLRKNKNYLLYFSRIRLNENQKKDLRELLDKTNSENTPSEEVFGLSDGELKLENLPYEILEKIFCYLSALELFKVAPVSKTFLAVCYQVQSKQLALYLALKAIHCKKDSEFFEYLRFWVERKHPIATEVAKYLFK